MSSGIRVELSRVRGLLEDIECLVCDDQSSSECPTESQLKLVAEMLGKLRDELTATKKNLEPSCDGVGDSDGWGSDDGFDNSVVAMCDIAEGVDQSVAADPSGSVRNEGAYQEDHAENYEIETDDEFDSFCENNAPAGPTFQITTEESLKNEPPPSEEHLRDKTKDAKQVQTNKDGKTNYTKEARLLFDVVMGTKQSEELLLEPTTELADMEAPRPQVLLKTVAPRLPVTGFADIIGSRQKAKTEDEDSFLALTRNEEPSEDEKLRSELYAQLVGLPVELESLGVTADILEAVTNAVIALSGDIGRLTPIKDLCPEHVEFGHIKAVLAYLQAKYGIENSRLNLPKTMTMSATGSLKTTTERPKPAEEKQVVLEDAAPRTRSEKRGVSTEQLMTVSKKMKNSSLFRK
ncbi:hypothetical protein HPB52_016395 [Rhipicephalus sanguineus]|uniref:Uncharacterized protein n=1 Tax=Rhipicephalus sanguineus TaxID=34632 RepID=A0A9D4PGD8_RHISA|nr:hypothetical protein HPB52_016395 [Rhipicephalus sanguineus]